MGVQALQDACSPADPVRVNHQQLTVQSQDGRTFLIYAFPSGYPARWYSRGDGLEGVERDISAMAVVVVAATLAGVGCAVVHAVAFRNQWTVTVFEESAKRRLAKARTKRRVQGELEAGLLVQSWARQLEAGITAKLLPY